MCGIRTSLDALGITYYGVDRNFRDLGSARDCEPVINIVDCDRDVNNATIELMIDHHKACSGQRFPYLAYQFVDAHSNSLLAAN